MHQRRLYDEIRQARADGTPLVKVIGDSGIIRGIKTSEILRGIKKTVHGGNHGYTDYPTLGQSCAATEVSLA
jgi:hypothetical protein